MRDIGELAASLQGASFTDDDDDDGGGSAQFVGADGTPAKGGGPSSGTVYLASERNFASLVAQVRTMLKTLAQSKQATAELWH